MRISYFPILATEMALGAELLPGMDKRAMYACVTRSLPAWPDIVHMWNPEIGPSAGIWHRKRRRPPVETAGNTAAQITQPEASRPEAASLI